VLFCLRRSSVAANAAGKTVFCRRPGKDESQRSKEERQLNGSS